MDPVANQQRGGGGRLIKEDGASELQIVASEVLRGKME